jgi:hypothetical protein
MNQCGFKIRILKFQKLSTTPFPLVYNVYGKRIFAVGTNGLDHYYEQPFNKLDLVWSNKLERDGMRNFQ